jgi:hypothetical protein
VRNTSGLEGEASLASEDFVEAVSIAGFDDGPFELGRLVLGAAMQAGLRERLLYSKQIATTMSFDGARKWGSHAAMVLSNGNDVRIATSG